MARQLRLVLVLLAAAIAALVWWRSRPEDPEAQIRALLEEVVAAAERRDLGGILTHVSEGFRGQGMNRDQLKGLLFVELRRGAWRKVVLYQTEIALAPDQRRAQVDTLALLAAGEQVKSLTDLVPTSGDQYRFRLELAREEDGVWRTTAASYEPARAGRSNR